MLRNTKIVLFLLLCFSLTAPVTPSYATNSHTSGPSRSKKGMPTHAEMRNLQVSLQKLELLATQADTLLTSFEGILDKTSTILSQKKEKFDAAQMQTTEEIIQLASQIRQSIYQGRTELFDNLKVAIQQGFSSESISQFMHGLASIMHLAAHFSSYLEKAVLAKMNYEKSFNIMRYMQTARQASPKKTLVSDMFTLQHAIISISDTFDHFEETRLNQVALFIENNIFSPFFKYHFDQILWYAGCWGGIGSLLLWKITQGYKAQKEFEYQKNNKLIGRDQYSHNKGVGQLKEITENNFYSGNRGIFQKRKSTQDPLLYSEEFSKTRGWFEKFGDFFENSLRLGHSEDYFLIEDLQQQNPTYRNTKMEIVGEQNLGKMYHLDKKVTDVVKSHYPLITVLATMVWPTFKENWDKNVWPSIKGNIQAGWNKLLGGMYEKRAIQGNYQVFSDITFDDIIGMEQEIEDLNILIEFLLNPISFAQQHGNKINKAFLFTGPTRTGKTHIFKAFVGTLQTRLRMLGRSITSIKAFEFKVNDVKKYGISLILDFVRQQGPAVLFIDEIDLAEFQRSRDTAVLSDALTSLGNALDGGDPSKPVVLLFATNKPQHIDIALKQPGRFGNEIPFDYPSTENRKRFLLGLFKKFGIDVSKFDIDGIVQQLNQLSYEKIDQLLHKSMMKASVKGIPFDQNTFEKVIDQEILKILSSDRKNLTPREWDILAAHFAGQALISLLVEMPETLHKITLAAIALESKEEHVVADVMQKDDEKQRTVVFGNTFTMTEGDTEKLATRELIVNHIKQLLSGFVAEEILLGSCGATCHPEYKDEAYSKAISLCLGGIKFDKLPDQQKTQYSTQAFELLEQYTKEVKTLLLEHKELLRIISETLLKQKTVTATQLQKLKDDFEKQKELKQKKAASPAPAVAA
jgi:ATP-dependent Zn protease